MQRLPSKAQSHLAGKSGVPAAAARPLRVCQSKAAAHSNNVRACVRGVVPPPRIVTVWTHICASGTDCKHGLPSPNVPRRVAHNVFQCTVSLCCVDPLYSSKHSGSCIRVIPLSPILLPPPPAIAPPQELQQQQSSSSSSSPSFTQRLTSAGAASLVGLAALSGVAAPAMASEFDLLAESKPTTSYYVDDASALSKSTKGDLNKKLADLEV